MLKIWIAAGALLFAACYAASVPNTVAGPVIHVPIFFSEGTRI